MVAGSSVTDSAPKQQGAAEKTAVPLVTESTRPAALPKTAGFDPTEPVAESPLKADATAAGTPPQPPVTTAQPQEMTATRTATVEETAAPGSIPQEQAPTTPEIAEDSPAEAAPAVESLKKFLSAGSLNERLKHTLGAEHMQPLMERYYKHSADGPVRVDRIQFIRMDPNPELGAGRHCIFSLENKTWEFPVPVMLEEQKDGFKVDWLAFVEFKDRMLEKFLQTYQEGPRRVFTSASSAITTSRTTCPLLIVRTPSASARHLQTHSMPTLFSTKNRHLPRSCVPGCLGRLMSGPSSSLSGKNLVPSNGWS
jgi:hypothetical protein